MVELARQMDLPLNVGTEMNSFGQPIVDDFDAPPLAPVRDAFMDGAYFIYGHTRHGARLGMGYQSAWAARSAADAGATQRVLHRGAGAACHPARLGSKLLARVHGEMAPEEVLRRAGA